LLSVGDVRGELLLLPAVLLVGVPGADSLSLSVLAAVRFSWRSFEDDYSNNIIEHDRQHFFLSRNFEFNDTEVFFVVMNNK
jgi:hypothetical protein